ncbi:MarR family winged helix-turn-helix transcriptional regulator [Hutsoniella sourekii]|uniref:MarR family winged helix-turn-helix transcriptional regulator n=1 Tax=Hutsoniella sourekii TaxID=87650 RepID=UPI00047F967A|nr:MarR family transcriptional regulator [Hutsoniella sourekii]
MEKDNKEYINRQLVAIFNEMLVIEEAALQASDFSDLSMREMHTIEAIGLFGRLSSKEVAQKLAITPGTLTVAIQNLVKKGYVERRRLEDDRRVVRLALTKKGKLIYRLHRKFHMNMVDRVTQDFDEAEVATLVKGLTNLMAFLDEVKADVNQELDRE